MAGQQRWSRGLVGAQHCGRTALAYRLYLDGLNDQLGLGCREAEPGSVQGLELTTSLS